MRYHPLPAVRGDHLARPGRSEEVRILFERAAGLTSNGRERETLAQRPAECGEGSGSQTATEGQPWPPSSTS